MFANCNLIIRTPLNMDLSGVLRLSALMITGIATVRTAEDHMYTLMQES
jgi:hypothetical protein